MPVPNPLSGQLPAAEDLEALAMRGTYSPSLAATITDPDLGTFGSISGTWYLTGQLVHVAFEVIFGSSGASAGDGVYDLSLPPTYPPDTSIYGGRHSLGQVMLRDDSGPSVRHYAVVLSNSDLTLVRFARQDASATEFVRNDSPWTWSNNDIIRGALTYITDA